MTVSLKHYVFCPFPFEHSFENVTNISWRKPIAGIDRLSLMFPENQKLLNPLYRGPNCALSNNGCKYIFHACPGLNVVPCLHCLPQFVGWQLSSQLSLATAQLPHRWAAGGTVLYQAPVYGGVKVWKGRGLKEKNPSYIMLCLFHMNSLWLRSNHSGLLPHSPGLLLTMHLLHSGYIVCSNVLLGSMQT